MERVKTRCRRNIRLIKQLQRQLYNIENQPRAWLMGEAEEVNNVAMNVLNREVARLMRKLDRWPSWVWDRETVAYVHEQGGGGEARGRI